jgi:hypothetical protein
VADIRTLTGPLPAPARRPVPPGRPSTAAAEPSGPEQSPPPTRTRSAGWRVHAPAAAVLAVAVLLQRPADRFIYDADGYFSGAVALVGGGNVFEEGGLGLRGVLTAFLYSPAALVARLGGDQLAGAAVLVQNAVLIAVLGAVLLPRLVGVWRSVTPVVVVVCAVGTGLTTAGFAPFPLSDLAAAALLVTVLVAVDQGSSRWLVVAGLAAGAAVNLRPATLLPLVVVGLAVLVVRRWSAAWAALGGAVALLPQFVLNLRHGSPGWLPVPEQTGWLTQLQAHYASHLVRYDTVVGAPPGVRPTLYWCSPEMAQSLGGQLPTSPTGLVGTYLDNLPGSIVFAAQKIGAALHWPLSTPYLTPAPVLDGAFAVLVTTVSVVGAAVLLRRTLSAGRGVSLGQVVGVLAWTMVVVGLATTATETRFALPVLLFGVAGCALLAGDGTRGRRRTASRRWVVGTVLAVLLTYGVGVTGMQHPYAVGADAQTCAAP